MDLMREAEQASAYLVQTRHHLHRHPELSGQETETLAFIARELQAMQIPFVEVEDGGILAFIHGSPGKGVLLRADIDALPIQEASENLKGPKAAVSRIPGVSHTCGHDAHTAMLLAEGKILQAHRSELPGSVVLCFERGEEKTGNAKHLIRYLRSHPEIRIDTCYATHVRWDIPSGKLAILDGAAMSGVFGFGFRLKGRSGHGSRPDLANSVLDCFSAIYNAVNMIRMRSVDPYQCLTFSVGSIQAGSQYNVVPDKLEFTGSVRHFDFEKAGTPFMTAFRRIVAAQAELFGCQAEEFWSETLYEAANNPACAALLRDAVRQNLGPDAVIQKEPWMASETFSMFQQLYPSVLTFTGIQNEALGSGANHHTPEFDVDDAALVTGVQAALIYATAFMEQVPEIPFQCRVPNVEDMLERRF